MSNVKEDIPIGAFQIHSHFKEVPETHLNVLKHSMHLKEFGVLLMSVKYSKGSRSKGVLIA